MAAFVKTTSCLIGHISYLRKLLAGIKSHPKKTYKSTIFKLVLKASLFTPRCHLAQEQVSFSIPSSKLQLPKIPASPQVLQIGYAVKHIDQDLQTVSSFMQKVIPSHPQTAGDLFKKVKPLYSPQDSSIYHLHASGSSVFQLYLVAVSTKRSSSALSWHCSTIKTNLLSLQSPSIAEEQSNNSPQLALSWQCWSTRISPHLKSSHAVFDSALKNLVRSPASHAKHHLFAFEASLHAAQFNKQSLLAVSIVAYPLSPKYPSSRFVYQDTPS